MAEIKLDFPDLQLGFAVAVREIRSAYLQDALSTTVSSMHIEDIDTELHTFVDNDSLSTLAAHGMRGESLFAVPCILKANPRLIGYYRLLLGYSQKYFYNSQTGAGVFKAMEDSGTLTARHEAALAELCGELNKNARYMLEHFESDMIGAAFFDQLTLLTLGAQFRGKSNVYVGVAAIKQVFDIILDIVSSSVTSMTDKQIELENRAGRTVNIQFSADPDIFIIEKLTEDVSKKSVAIEIKGGRDYANIHNRIGEAEKSHQKAKKDGFVECWTIVNVDGLDMEMAIKESPTTNRFYHLAELLDTNSSEYRDFSLQILSIVGI